MAENHSAETILQEALELSDLQERAAYLDEACGDDEALRGEIESLLAAHFAADAFMDTLADPVWQEAPTEKEGDRIGRYKLLQQIGEGGFGTVYMSTWRSRLMTAKPARDTPITFIDGVWPSPTRRHNQKCASEQTLQQTRSQHVLL